MGATVTYSYKAETVSATCELTGIDSTTPHDEVREVLEQYIEDVYGWEIESPHGSINGDELAFGEVQVEKVEFA